MAWTLATFVMAWGVVAAVVYWLQGLTLSHYDARAHLVVARRIIDSLTPGWQQIGAVWLPLPHLLNMLPVQVDWLYRTGASGVAISVASLGVGVYAVASIVVHATGSRMAAALTAALLALNPNLLYLQSTPMTEPLLFGLLLLSAWFVYRWSDEPDRWRPYAGWALVGACLTRYEAWPFTGAVLVLGVIARWQSGASPAGAMLEGARLALYPALAVVGFMAHSRATVGAWFVTGGFYIPDPAMQGQMVAVTQAIWRGATRLGSHTLIVGAIAASAGIVWVAIRRRRLALLVPLALIAVAALPWYGFFQGHPFRIRYMLPVVVAAIACIGIGIGLLSPRARAAAATAVLLGVLLTTRPFDARAALVQEAGWDIERTRARQAVTACLAGRDPGDVVLMSMSALAHYMQDLSRAGFGIRDFVHEGNGDLWIRALERPRAHVKWMLIDMGSRHRDQLKARMDDDPAFLDGFTRVCEAANVALFRRE